MSTAVDPASARCSVHAEAVAQRTCARCGAFMCSGCERRVRIDSTPMCARCWDLREQRLPYPEPANPLATVGVVLGVSVLVAQFIALNMGLIAVLALAAVPIGVNVIALFRPGGKTRAGAGLGLSLLATAIGVAVALVS